MPVFQLSGLKSCSREPCNEELMETNNDEWVNTVGQLVVKEPDKFNSIIIFWIGQNIFKS